jgi:hypothetical protein
VGLAEHGADEADDGVAVREDPDYVGAPADLAVEPLLRVARPDLPPVFFREPGEGEELLGGVRSIAAALGKRLRSCSTMRVCWARTDSASGCMKIVRT